MEQKITLEMSQIAIQEPKIFLSKWYQSHKYLDMKKSQFLFYKIFVGKIPHITFIAYRFRHYRYRQIWKMSYGKYEKCHIGILSVSADKKIECIGHPSLEWCFQKNNWTRVNKVWFGLMSYLGMLIHHF